MLGNWAVGKPSIDPMPTSTVRLEGTIPKIGRAVKNRIMVYPNLVAVPDRRYLIVALQFGNGALRDQQRVGFNLRHSPHATELSGAEDVSGVGKGSDHADGSQLRIHLPVCENDFSFL